MLTLIQYTAWLPPGPNKPEYQPQKSVMWLLGWTHVLSPNSTGWTFLVVILVPLFLMQLHVLDQVKAIAETQFILPFLYLPYLGFCWYTRSHRSGFLLPHLRIRGVLKWSVRWVWAFTLLPLHRVGCTSF